MCVGVCASARALECISCEVLLLFIAAIEVLLATLQMTLTVALAATGTAKWGAATMVTSTATTTMEALQLLHLPRARAENHQPSEVTPFDQMTEASRYC